MVIDIDEVSNASGRQAAGLSSAKSCKGTFECMFAGFLPELTSPFGITVRDDLSGQTEFCEHIVKQKFGGSFFVCPKMNKLSGH